MVNGGLRIAAVLLALIASAASCIAVTEPHALVPATADQDPALPQIRLRVAGHSRAVHVETYGDEAAPVILVLHGSLGDFRALRMMKALADRYRVILWDQRGNGLSERISADEYTWDSVVEEIDAIAFRYAPGRKVTLIGHSFGAMYAALFTARHPERVEQLVLLEPGGLNGRIFQETFDSVISVDLLDPAMNAMFWQNELLSPGAHETMDHRALMILLNGQQTNYFCDPDHPPAYPVWRPGAYVEYVRGLRMGTGGGFGTPHFDFDFSTGLERFEAKTLIVAGTCSALGPDFQRRYHVPLFARAELATIEGAGHRMFVEKPDAVLSAVRSYLRQYAP